MRQHQHHEGLKMMCLLLLAAQLYVATAFCA